ncbi:MAG: hypothetical protein JWM33_3612 [Caulobacteraceae bacterium]|nr:hypothetical protein [Caulobacteraceae bacterium]
METFDAIKFTVSGSARPVSELDVLAAEASLHCKFPSDYRRFIQKYGAGYFRRLPVRVFSPQQIVASTPADQQRLREHWFWEESADILTQQAGVRSVACFDTDIGHDIRFLPQDASALFVLSRYDGSITRCCGFADIVRLLDPDYHSCVYEFHPFNAA